MDEKPVDDNATTGSLTEADLIRALNRLRNKGGTPNRFFLTQPLYHEYQFQWLKVHVYVDWAGWLFPISTRIKRWRGRRWRRRLWRWKWWIK